MSTVELAPSKTIVLMSSDGELFYVEEFVMCECKTIKHMNEDNCTNGTIPLPNISSKILAKVIEYCKHHAQDAAIASISEPDLLLCQKVGEENLKKFDSEFVNVNQAILFDLIIAANYLNTKKLLDLTCQAMADIIKAKTPEETRKENSWAFE